MSILFRPDKQVKERVARFFRLERSQDFRKYISVRELELRGYSKDTACKSDKTERRKAQSQETQLLRIFPSCTEIRNMKVESNPSSNSTNSPGVRNITVEFTSKSRMALMKKFCSLEEFLKYWQDFTFPDDVMENLTIKERAGKSRTIFKRWLRKARAEGIEINGIWKREWKKRRQGRLKGQFVPHYHFLYNLAADSPEQFLRLAVLWVESTKTEMFTEALMVAVNQNSYRMVKSKKQAQKYIGKYVSKNEGFVSTESIGRSWGIVGNLKFAQGEEIQITEKEATILKRCFRKIYRNFRQNRNMRIRLRKKFTEFTMFLESSTIMRMIEQIRLQDLSEWFEAAPCET